MIGVLFDDTDVWTVLEYIINNVPIGTQMLWSLCNDFKLTHERMGQIIGRLLDWNIIKYSSTTDEYVDDKKNGIFESCEKILKGIEEQTKKLDLDEINHKYQTFLLKKKIDKIEKDIQEE